MQGEVTRTFKQKIVPRIKIRRKMEGFFSFEWNVGALEHTNINT